MRPCPKCGAKLHPCLHSNHMVWHCHGCEYVENRRPDERVDA